MVKTVCIPLNPKHWGAPTLFVQSRGPGHHPQTGGAAKAPGRHGGGDMLGAGSTCPAHGNT